MAANETAFMTIGRSKVEALFRSERERYAASGDGGRAAVRGSQPAGRGVRQRTAATERRQAQDRGARSARHQVLLTPN